MLRVWMTFINRGYMKGIKIILKIKFLNYKIDFLFKLN